ncbi:MAG: hypothetical protein KAY37_07065 [Phycisphaerae bacterium]|nr:hypothetical protein [Phycisphaerae bacterium]
MKLDVIRGKEAATCAAIGVAGALIFLFAFPKGAISTLMHEVLDLPGPGAGIALIVGPFLIIVALISSLLSRGDGGAVIASLTFAVAYVLVASLLGIPTNPKGAFGSPVFIAAVAPFSIAAEAVMVLGKALKTAWRCMASGALANAVLLVFYWIVIFPRTYRWIDWGDVPLLMGLCLACGLASGYIACAISKPLSRALALKEKE